MLNDGWLLVHSGVGLHVCVCVLELWPHKLQVRTHPHTLPLKLISLEGFLSFACDVLFSFFTLHTFSIPIRIPFWCLLAFETEQKQPKAHQSKPPPCLDSNLLLSPFGTRPIHQVPNSPLDSIIWEGERIKNSLEIGLLLVPKHTKLHYRNCVQPIYSCKKQMHASSPFMS